MIENKLMRRVQGYHDLRMDGITDLVLRARDAAVLDIGCNRGLVAFEMANNGARLCHGCDSFVEGIECARQIFADLRNVESRFEVVDLARGPAALNVFASQRYDITLMLATYHKLKRVMALGVLSGLMAEIAGRTNRYFGWRATSDKPGENDEEMKQLDRDLRDFRRIHTSYISEQLGVAAIWERR